MSSAAIWAINSRRSLWTTFSLRSLRRPWGTTCWTICCSQNRIADCLSSNLRCRTLWTMCRWVTWPRDRSSSCPACPLHLCQRFLGLCRRLTTYHPLRQRSLPSSRRTLFPAFTLVRFFWLWLKCLSIFGKRRGYLDCRLLREIEPVAVCPAWAYCKTYFAWLTPLYLLSCHAIWKIVHSWCLCLHSLTQWPPIIILSLRMMDTSWIPPYSCFRGDFTIDFGIQHTSSAVHQHIQQFTKRDERHTCGYNQWHIALSTCRHTNFELGPEFPTYRPGATIRGT